MSDKSIKDKSHRTKSFLGMGEASRLIGVSETTLRRWTDDGLIRVFVTPGGHRRYSASELRQFLQARQAVQQAGTVTSHLQETLPGHRIAARRNVASSLDASLVSKEGQERLAQYGRELLDLVIQYIAYPNKRKASIERVRHIGEEHGRTLASMGFPLIDSIQAFTSHRNLLVEAAAQFGRRDQLGSRRAIKAIPLVNRLLDEALVCLVAAHQACWRANSGLGNGERPR